MASNDNGQAALAQIQHEQPEQNKIVPVDSRPLDVQKFELNQRAAKLFAMSGLFSDIRGQSLEQSIAQAFVKISLGESMGFTPAESMTGIDIIQGRVAVSANIRAARMQRAGYSWDILQLDEKGCRIALKFKGQPILTEVIDGASGEVRKVQAVVSYSVEDASRAGLLSKDNYKKNPLNMFFARAIANAQRWYAPGVIGMNILDTEEALTLEPPNPRGEAAAAGTSATLEKIKETYGKKSETPAEQPQQPTEQPPVEPKPRRRNSQSPTAEGLTFGDPNQAVNG